MIPPMLQYFVYEKPLQVLGCLAILSLQFVAVRFVILAPSLSYCKGCSAALCSDPLHKPPLAPAMQPPSKNGTAI